MMETTDKVRWSLAVMAAFGAAVLGGCTRAPAVDILGSFFPGWLICFMLAVALTGVCRTVLTRFRIRFDLPLLVYPSLVMFFTCLLWLMFFY